MNAFAAKRSWPRVQYAMALALATGIVAAGCGSDTGSGDDAGSKSGSASSTTPDAKVSDSPKATGDPCGLVSDDTVAGVLGVKIARREPHSQPGSQSVSCLKGVKRANDPRKFFYVNVAVVAGGGTVLLDKFGTQQGSSPVASLGDRAIYVPSVGGVFIADGADAVQVQVVKAGKPGSRQDCVTIAKDVLNNRH